MLELKDIIVYYGDLQVLWNVSLKVNEGEVVAIIGSNGAGKTTILKTISGLLHPSSGSIEFFDVRIDKMKPYQIVGMGVSHVPEGRRLFPYMTVLENLELGVRTPEAKKRKKESLEWIFDLFPRLKEKKAQLAGTLSGGEQQMLAVARGLISRPKLLLLDEPSLGLAPIITQEIFKVIRRINEEGVTLLLVEQNVVQALNLANRAYVVENGRIILEGKARELLQNENVKKAYLGL